jgi:hypothetical protein
MRTIFWLIRELFNNTVSTLGLFIAECYVNEVGVLEKAIVCLLCLPGECNENYGKVKLSFSPAQILTRYFPSHMGLLNFVSLKCTVILY